MRPALLLVLLAACERAHKAPRDAAAEPREMRLPVPVDELVTARDGTLWGRGYQRLVRIDVGSGTADVVAQFPLEMATTLSVAPDGAVIVAGSGRRFSAWRFDPGTGRGEGATWSADTAWTTAVCGSQAIVDDVEHAPMVVDVVSGERLGTVPATGIWVPRVKMLAPPRVLLSNEDFDWRIYDRSTGDVGAPLPADPDEMVFVSPDGGRIVFRPLRPAGVLVVWDVVADRELARLEASPVEIAFVDRGLITADAAGRVTRWDASWRPTTVAEMGTAPSASAATRDGKLAIVAGTTLRIVD